MSEPGVGRGEDRDIVGKMTRMIRETKSTSLLVTMDDTPVDEIMRTFAETYGVELTEVTPGEFLREAYKRMRQVVEYFAQRIEKRSDEDVQIDVLFCRDGGIFMFAKKHTVISYGLTKERTYLAYASPSEAFVIVTDEAIPFFDVVAPDEETDEMIRQFLISRIIHEEGDEP